MHNIEFDTRLFVCFFSRRWRLNFCRDCCYSGNFFHFEREKSIDIRFICDIRWIIDLRRVDDSLSELLKERAVNMWDSLEWVNKVDDNQIKFHWIPFIAVKMSVKSSINLTVMNLSILRLFITLLHSRFNKFSSHLFTSESWNSWDWYFIKLNCNSSAVACKTLSQTFEKFLTYPDDKMQLWPSSARVQFTQISGQSKLVSEKYQIPDIDATW